ncbi:glycosyltransferase family 4 protein [Saccharothrix australiensis]|uniref:Glycosyltransferase involved in cell wall biosynthesis n=1 Tax=Saccharothrix australiensis TaxID=2072 RepID=A0A495VZ35_9PSEU|nr:glycosyltransferase family 4 protein [Saccharothrix australiensis]RKT54484.1 glycosyltransferase involved in cell wall biosynthesis [Saccharothrix australiensis]
MTNVARLRGKHLAVLNWRDVRHPQAGGAEWYLHHIARRWVGAGVRVTWLTARPEALPAHEVIDGVDVVRAGGALSVYPAVAWRLLRERGRFDAIVDCQNGIPFFAPLFAGGSVPVVQVVHHVHQEQFADRFSPPMAAVGRFLEGPVARRVYGRRLTVAVSPSTRTRLRQRLGWRGPICIVPNGTAAPAGATAPRAPDPTITVVSRLVPHKRLDLLLSALPPVAARLPGLRVDVVGDGVELPRLRDLAARLGLHGVVTFHGRQPDAVRDGLLDRAWLTACTSAGEGWGCSIVEAAGRGVPCLAVDAPGVRDSVIHGRTGRLVADADDLPAALVDLLTDLADPGTAAAFADRCRAWAGCFTWERSAELLAGVLVQEAAGQRTGCRRTARPDIATVVRCAPGVAPGVGRLRATDEVATHRDGTTTVLLAGCDDFDAPRVVARLGLTVERVRLADRYDLLSGPAGLPARLAPADEEARRA